MSTAAEPLRLPLAASRVALVAVVALAELAILTAVVVAADFNCHLTARATTCNFLTPLAAQGAAVAALGALYLLARMGLITAGARSRPHSPGPWPAVQVGGFLLILVPLLVAGSDLERVFRIAPVPWALGAMLATSGALLWLLPGASWQALLRHDPVTPILLVLAGLAAPTLFAVADQAWQWSPLAHVTFKSVAALAQLFGAAQTDLSQYLIIVGDFAVQIGDACSGIQGFALITGLIATYFWIDRASLNFARAWILLPIGLALSFALNVVRITLLLVIGARVSPELAIDGFHSHAGWLMFVLLGLPLVGLARALPWFRTAPAPDVRRPAPPPLARDRNAALIVPFMALMFSSLVASTFALVPELWYPLKVGAVLAALAPFLPLLRGLAWRPDAAAIGTGLAVGAAWALTQPAASAGDTALVDALAALPASWLAAWIALRVIGSVLLVPLVEEAFFRGYLLTRLDGLGWRRVAALLVSAGLFALLHDRWIAALLAGLVLGLVMLRRGRLADAVAAHAAANLVLAALAVAQGDLSAF